MTVEEVVDEGRAHVREIRWDTGENLKKAKAEYKKNYDKGTKGRDVQIGDLGYVRVNKHTLDPVYEGPQEVISVMCPDVQVRDCRRGLRVVHLNKCRVVKHTEVVELPMADEGEVEISR